MLPTAVQQEAGGTREQVTQHRVGTPPGWHLEARAWQSAHASRGISRFLPNQDRSNRGTRRGVLCLWTPKTLHAQHGGLWWALKPGERGCLASSPGEKLAATGDRCLGQEASLSGLQSLTVDASLRHSPQELASALLAHCLPRHQRASQGLRITANRRSAQGGPTH